jgi:uncharacterized protein YegP (UPF0339 family)
MSAQFELRQNQGGSFHFTLKAANGEKLLSSETYTSKPGALSGIASVKSNAPQDARYDRKTSKSGEPYFVLTAANGEPIGTSETYSSTGARDKGIEAIKRAAPDAQLDDLT